MAKGVDTTFLVQLEIRESASHARAREFLEESILSAGQVFALAPQVLLEFVHVVTDPKRFERPLSMNVALKRADFWWAAREVQRVYPDLEAVRLFLHWMGRYRLGRKRLLDTFLAATYATHGVAEIVSSNARDYGIYEGVTPIDPTL
jgi:predicted nucleic acid-binding protein